MTSGRSHGNLRLTSRGRAFVVLAVLMSVVVAVLVLSVKHPAGIEEPRSDRGTAATRAAADKTDVFTDAVSHGTIALPFPDPQRHFLGKRHSANDRTGGVPDVTLVVMSYPGSTRHHLLQRIVAAAIRWPFVVQVILVWNGAPEDLPVSLHAFIDSVNQNATRLGLPGAATAAATVLLLPQASNRVDNRWRIGAHINTTAVLNMDDDINLSEEGARCMLSVWAASPSAIVALDVRSHFHHQMRSNGAETRGPHGEWGYAARDTSGGFKTYSIALPRTLVANRAFYFEYARRWSEPQSKLRALVDELLCDDIAFSFVAMNTTTPHGPSSVIYTKAKYSPFPESHSKTAMFNQPGMKAKRQQCVNRIASELFGGEMPLRPRRWHVMCDVDG